MQISGETNEWILFFYKLFWLIWNKISAKFQKFGEKICKFMQNYVNLCKFLEKSLNALNFKFILIILYEFMSN